MYNPSNVYYFDVRLAIHRTRLSQLIEYDSETVLKCLQYQTALYKRINKQFAQGEINFNVSELDSLNFLVYELELSLHLINCTDSITIETENALKRNIKKCFKEIKELQGHLSNLIAPATKKFNPVDMVDIGDIYSILLRSNY